jgi:hypothetical protein
MPLNFQSRIAFPHPRDEFFRHRHSRKPALANERPIIEKTRLFDLSKCRRRIDVMQEFQLDDPQLVVLRVGTRLAGNLCDSHDPRLATGVIDEDTIAGMHRFDRLQRLRVLDAVPNRRAVALKIGNRVDGRLGLGKKVVHRGILLNLKGLPLVSKRGEVLMELEYNDKECFRLGTVPEARGLI